MKVSVIVPTQRIGGLDVLFAGLEQQRHRDFELILVDALHFHRRDIVRAHAPSFPLIHIPPLGNSFPVHTYCRSVNTGLVHASGDIVLLTCDHSWLHPGVLETHVAKTRPGLATITPFQIVTCPPVKLPQIYGPGDSSCVHAQEQLNTWMDAYCLDLIDGKLDPFMWSILEAEATIESNFATLPVEHISPTDVNPEGVKVDTFSSVLKCDSFALSDLLDVNGLNEYMDGSQPFQDSELAYRLEAKKGLHFELGAKGVYAYLPQVHKYLFLRRTLRGEESNRARLLELKNEGFIAPINRWNLRTRRAELSASLEDWNLARTPIISSTLNPLNEGWEIRESHLRNASFKFVCHHVYANHPSWYSFQDEQDVRERWWKIAQNDVVVDAGTAYGSYTVSALAQGAAKTFCWSPEGDEYEFLQASVGVNGWTDKMVARRDGLWSKPGFLIAHSYERPPEFFATKEEAEAVASAYVRVRDEPMPQAFPVRTLDDVVIEEHHATRVDWLKLDVEGAEVEVLKGATNLLKRFRPNVLVENHLFKDATIKDQVADLLIGLGVGYEEVGTVPYYAISHSLYTARKVQSERKGMKIALVLGNWSTQNHPPFDLSGLYEKHALTGSESFFFNTVRGLAELGHEVVAFCDCVAPSNISGASVLALNSVGQIANGFDAVLAWNEPDQLRAVKDKSTLRACMQQVNDFSYCAPDFDKHVDVYCFPSEVHRAFMIRSCGIGEKKTAVVPNSINLEFFEGTSQRIPNSIAYCSSPDRGLHWLLDFFPAVRKRVPDASLWIYYEMSKWREAVENVWEPGETYRHKAGLRARYINEAIRRLEGKGVHVVGAVPSTEMAKRLMTMEVFAYPCDTVLFTEGFSVATLDACAAECFPIISDRDAIASVHGHAVKVIPGNPGENRETWIDSIVSALKGTSTAPHDELRKHARSHSRESIAERWKTLIETLLQQKRS